MRLFIAGDPESGKDALGLAIEKLFKMPACSSSLAAMPHVYGMSPELKLKYPDARAAWEDRRTPENRVLWHDYIVKLNTPNLTTLGRILLEDHDVYVGIRNPDEFEACKKAGLCDLSIWVTSDIRGSKESAKSNGMSPHMCDMEFRNNCETLGELETKVQRVFGRMLKREYGPPLIYVAGPYSSNPDANVSKAMNYWKWLREDGFNPYIPHLSHFIEQQHPHHYEFWMDHCFDMLERCDALFRMPGMSPGSDREVKYAREYGIPVFHDYESLTQHFKRREI